jgi:copper transporter 1
LGEKRYFDAFFYCSQMYFEAGYKATILFEQWNTDSIGAMVGSCIGIFLLAIIYEGLKFFR